MMVYHNPHMGVSENSGTPKSSILIGFSIINHPFWITPIFGNYIPQTNQVPFFAWPQLSSFSSISGAAAYHERRLRQCHITKPFGAGDPLVHSHPAFGGCYFLGGM